jgi:hypothetical protein
MAEYKGILQLSEKGPSYLLMCEQKLKNLKGIDVAVFNENPVEKSVEYINDFLKSNGISNDDFSLSITIPPGKFSYRYLSLPPLKGKRLEELVRFEWIRQTPFNENDVEIKFVPVFKKERTLVSAFLVQKGFIEKITSSFLQHRIYIESIVPEPYAVFTLFPSFPIVIIGFNTDASFSISVVDDKETSIWIFPKNEKSMIKPLLRSYRSKHGALPDTCFIYGDNNFQADFLEEFGVRPVSYTQPDYIEFVTPLNYEEQIKILPAIGLGGIILKGLEHPEFSKPEFKSPLKIRNIKTIYLTLGISCALFLIFFTGSSLFHLNYYKSEYMKRSSEVTEIFKKSFPDVENIVDPVAQMKEKLNLLRARGKGGGGKVIDFIKWLRDDISAIGNVKITEMLVDAGKVRLKGQTKDLSIIDAFEKKLRERKFRDVRLTRTQKSLKEEIYEFEITLEL